MFSFAGSQPKFTAINHMKTLDEFERACVQDVAKVTKADKLPSSPQVYSCGFKSQVPGLSTNSITLRERPLPVSVIAYFPAGSCSTP